MLKVTVTLIPGGVGQERPLGELLIANVGGGARADYKCVLAGADLPMTLHGAIHGYPRWSATVWDLVGRAIAASLSGCERLPRRPRPLNVPVHQHGTISYVRLSEIPEPARSAFEHRMTGAAVPVIAGETDCVYAWHWLGFIGGGRR